MRTVAFIIIGHYKEYAMGVRASSSSGSLSVDDDFLCEHFCAGVGFDDVGAIGQL